MKTYDLIIIGTGSATNILEAIIERDPHIRIALIDKDEPGGICLTKGCIPSKILVYPAELVRVIEGAAALGIRAEIRELDFAGIMERMRSTISKDIEEIRSNLSRHPNIDYYRDLAEFTAPYAMKVGTKKIKANMIFLCTGSKPLLPPLEGLEETGYLTSDTLLQLTGLPRSLLIVGGGYIAAEYGHFFSAMGSEVTIVGRNPQFLPAEEPEVSALARREMSRYMTILTGYEVRRARKLDGGRKEILARESGGGNERTLSAQEILMASGRAPNTDILHPEKAAIKTDEKGWIEVNEFLETSQPNVWAFGDADGKYLFKHKANYESILIFMNAILGRKMKADYHAVPHAVFSYPEIAAVGMREREAVDQLGKDGVLIGHHRYQETAKGLAMGVKNFFVKVILRANDHKILGAHIIGPQASVLIQEIITAMYTPEGTPKPITQGMHIHPALSEVVERAFQSLMPPAHYRHTIAQNLDWENDSRPVPEEEKSTHVETSL